MSRVGVYSELTRPQNRPTATFAEASLGRSLAVSVSISGLNERWYHLTPRIRGLPLSRGLVPERLARISGHDIHPSSPKAIIVVNAYLTDSKLNLLLPTRLP